MNTPHDPSDPVLQSLTEEAADLPARAAIAARQRNAQRLQTRQRLALAAVAALLGFGTWGLLPSREKQPANLAAHSAVSAVSPDLANSAHSPGLDAPFAQGVAQARLPLPSGLNEEQAEFVKAVGDVPMLFVRDASGKVARIHIVER